MVGSFVREVGERNDKVGRRAWWGYEGIGGGWMGEREKLEAKESISFTGICATGGYGLMNLGNEWTPLLHGDRKEVRKRRKLCENFSDSRVKEWLGDEK